jgi:hypothetical protein
MQIITSFFQCLGDVLDLNDNFRKKQEARAYAKELQAVYQRGKSAYYYDTIEKIVYSLRDLERSGGMLELSSLRMEEAVCDDVLLLQSIVRYKELKDIPELKQKVRLALKMGFSTKVLQKVVGALVDVEALTENSKKEKWKEYISIVNESCGICLWEFDEEDMIAKKVHRVATCHHFYHLDCVAEWAKNSETCPGCKIQFNLIEDHTKWRKYLVSIESAIRKHFRVPDDRVISDGDTLKVEPGWVQESRAAVKRFCEKWELERRSEALAQELEKENSEEGI